MQINAIAMQHNVDYSVCKNNKKCENEVDRKLSKLLQFLIMKDSRDISWRET